MPKTSGRPNEADADAETCPLYDNDPLLKEPINDEWLELADDRICREYARQLIQQENMPMSTNNLTRLGNVRVLDALEKQLERIARRRTARGVRTATKNMVNVHDAFDALERSILPELEMAATERDSEKVSAE